MHATKRRVGSRPGLADAANVLSTAIRADGRHDHVTVRAAASYDAAQVPPSVQAAEPSTYVVLSGTTSLAIRPVWSSAPVAPASKV